MCIHTYYKPHVYVSLVSSPVSQIDPFFNYFIFSNDKHHIFISSPYPRLRPLMVEQEYKNSRRRHNISLCRREHTEAPKEIGLALGLKGSAHGLAIGISCTRVLN